MFNKTYETWLDIDLGAIRKNLQMVRKISGLPTAAVIKADAYGHGIVPVSQAAIQAGAIMLAVARFNEARELRNAGFTEPILVLGMIPPENVMEACVTHVRGTLFNQEQIAIYENILSGTGHRLSVHVKIDSGMGRLGFPAEEGLRLLQAVRDSRYLEAEGLFTHLARADEPGIDTTDWQLDRFDRLLQEVEANGLRPRLVHTANSAGALFHPRCGKYDMVRVGEAMYGMNPSPDALLPEGFRPALSWKAGITSVKMIPGGMGISYGHHYTTHGVAQRVGVIPVGYADGYRRVLGNTVLVRGKAVPVIGSVCMDQCMIDLNDIPNAKIGDEAVLIGQQGGAEISVDQVAKLWGTINYDVTCGIAKRVSRYYLRGDE